MRRTTVKTAVRPAVPQGRIFVDAVFEPAVIGNNYRSVFGQDFFGVQYFELLVFFEPADKNGCLWPVLE